MYITGLSLVPKDLASSLQSKRMVTAVTFFAGPSLSSGMTSSSLKKITSTNRPYHNRLATMFSNGTAEPNPREQFKEIRIPVPWGYIAGKEYGKSAGHPILALHGSQDNLGTFDLLIPMLSPDLHIIAVDLPGHGLSSHKPLGMLYHAFDWVADIHRVVEHLQWQKFSFLGHSLGAAIAFAYSGCFPEKVLKVVSLDVVTAHIFPIETLPKRMAVGMGQLLYSENSVARNPRPVNATVAKEVLLANQNGSLLEESANIQLKRGTVPVDSSGKVVFTRDYRLLIAHMPGITPDQVKSLAKNVSCEILIILANQGTSSSYASDEDIADLLRIYRKAAKTFKMVRMDGSHHVHLNNPTLVAPYINEFLQFSS